MQKNSHDLCKFWCPKNQHFIGKHRNPPKSVQNIPCKDPFLGQRSSMVNFSHKLAYFIQILVSPKICILLENIEIFQHRSKTSLLRTRFLVSEAPRLNSSITQHNLCKFWCRQKFAYYWKTQKSSNIGPKPPF